MRKLQGVLIELKETIEYICRDSVNRLHLLLASIMLMVAIGTLIVGLIWIITN